MIPRTRTTGLGLFFVLLAAPALGQTAGMLSFPSFVKNGNGDPGTGSVTALAGADDTKGRAARHDISRVQGVLCEFEAADNCQPAEPPGFDDNGSRWFVPSDRRQTDSVFGLMSADDFIPLATTIRNVCVQGWYIDPLNLANYDCGGVVDDDFLVRIYENDPATNLPGNLVGESDTIITDKSIEIEDFGTRGPNQDQPLDVYRIQLELATPIDVVPGDCHWIEVSNDPRGINPPAGDTCDWYQATRNSSGIARDGNDYYATSVRMVDLPVPFSPSWEAWGQDLAFCLDVPFEPGGCGDRSAACQTGSCAGGGGSCADIGPFACSAMTRSVFVSGETCATVDPQQDFAPGDDCDDTTFQGGSCTGGGTCAGGANDGAACTTAVECFPNGGCNCAPNGPILITTPDNQPFATSFNNACATTDGFNPTLSDVGFRDLGSDIWFLYIATCTGRLRVSQCGTPPAAAQGLDTFMAVYHDPSEENRKHCSCALATAGNENLWPDRGNDEGCNNDRDGGGGVVRGTNPVAPGDCFLIRAGGLGGATGPSTLDLICEPLDCPASLAPISVQVQDAVGETATVDLQTNRMLGLVAGDVGRAQLIRITLTSLPAPFGAWAGQTMWVTEPQDVCSLPGQPDPLECGSAPVFQIAGLSCDEGDAHVTDWTTVGEFYVTHPAIVPTRVVSPGNPPVLEVAEYSVQVLDSKCVPDDERNFSSPLVLQSSIFGDVVGPFDPDTSVWVAPNGTADIFPDILGLIDAFAFQPDNMTKIRADIEPCILDFRINFTDVVFALDAFRGLPFPFGPGVRDCPQDPCD